MATMRAGVTHWQAGLIEVGHGMICKAYSILMVTHGPTHPITKDLEVCSRQGKHSTCLRLLCLHVLYSSKYSHGILFLELLHFKSALKMKILKVFEVFEV